MSPGRAQPTAHGSSGSSATRLHVSLLSNSLICQHGAFWQDYCFEFPVECTTARIAADLARYCATHPDACDSLEGLAWWATLERYQEVREEIAAAVDDLVARGVLRRHELQDGSVVFSCSKRTQK